MVDVRVVTRTGVETGNFKGKGGKGKMKSGKHFGEGIPRDTV